MSYAIPPVVCQVLRSTHHLLYMVLRVRTYRTYVRTRVVFLATSHHSSTYMYLHRHESACTQHPSNQPINQTNNRVRRRPAALHGCTMGAPLVQPVRFVKQSEEDYRYCHSYR